LWMRIDGPPPRPCLPVTGRPPPATLVAAGGEPRQGKPRWGPLTPL